MWIDSHAHLYDITDENLEIQLKDAAIAGVGHVVSTAIDCASSRSVIKQAENRNMVWGAVGISPFDAASPPATWAAELDAMLVHPKIIALGEIGIDSTNPRYPSMELQLHLFEKQLDLARKHHLPAIIHSRGAEETAVRICKERGITHALFHCFTGDGKSLAAVIDAGYHVSISGIATFRNTALRELIARIPADRLLIETDSPYLAPVPHRGEKNRPAWVALTGQEIARILGADPEALAGQIETNFRRLFRKFSAAA